MSFSDVLNKVNEFLVIGSEFLRSGELARQEQAIQDGYNAYKEGRIKNAIDSHFSTGYSDCMTLNRLYERGIQKARAERYQEQHKKSLESYGLSCKRCQGVAYPVEGTERHYKCKCGHRFTGARHPF